jgi:peptidoglycan/xylan/chitin deacetylase (PgdA/CDA1 family)
MYLSALNFRKDFQRVCAISVAFLGVGLFTPTNTMAANPGIEGVSEPVAEWLKGYPGFVRDYNRLCPAGPARSQRIPVQYTLKSPAAVFGDGNLPDKHVVLSFDDGPHLIHTELVLKVLEKCGITAHFFPVGRQAVRPRKAALLRRTAQAGHMVGSHSHSHQNLQFIPYKDARDEILRGHDEVVQATGVFRPFFRFPFGAGVRSPRLLRVLQKRGLVSMFWNIAVPDISVQNSRDLLVRSMASIEKRRRGVILMHDVKRHTLLMLPRMIRLLDEQGYTFAVLDPDVEPGHVAWNDDGSSGNAETSGGHLAVNGHLLRPPMPAPRP